MDHELLLTPNEVAEVLSVKPATLNFWRATGQGPAFVRISKRCVRYRCADIQNWIDARVEEGPQAKRVAKTANRKGA
jgi:predicted DNA-binding transcriptional regulator AlpA